MVVPAGVEDGAKLKVELDPVGAAGFSGAFDDAVVGVPPNNDGAAVDVALGVTEGVAFCEALCCLSRIFDIAAASRSCFSHFEYDLVFWSLGLSAAGEAGA